MRTYLDYQPFISIFKIGVSVRIHFHNKRWPCMTLTRYNDRKTAFWKSIEPSTLTGSSSRISTTKSTKLTHICRSASNKEVQNASSVLEWHLNWLFLLIGGILTALFNFSWLIRLDVWMLCLAYYFSHDNSLCIPEILQILAKVKRENSNSVSFLVLLIRTSFQADWIVKTLSLLLHITVVTFPLTTFKSILHFIVYFAAGIGIWGGSIGLSIGTSGSISSTTDSSGVSVTEEGGGLANTYLLLTAVAAICEVMTYYRCEIINNDVSS